MAEAVGLTSGLVALVAITYTTCQSLYNTIRVIHDAPKHIQLISNDLEDFYRTFGVLQSQLNNEVSDELLSEERESLKKAMENSLSILKATMLLVGSYKCHRPFHIISGWLHPKWSFKKNGFEELRRSLTCQK